MFFCSVIAACNFSSGISISARTAVPSGSPGPLLTFSVRQTTEPRQVFDLGFFLGRLDEESGATGRWRPGGLPGSASVLAASALRTVEPVSAGAEAAAPAPMRSTILPLGAPRAPLARVRAAFWRARIFRRSRKHKGRDRDESPRRGRPRPRQSQSFARRLLAARRRERALRLDASSRRERGARACAAASGTGS